MNIICIIPARMGSSRFPGKPMALIANKPMIGHVYEGVIGCKLITKTIIATCDEEISEYITSIGGEAVMTSSMHERASDRCAEALIYIEEKYNTRFDIVVMVQGDEPMINPTMIEEALIPMIEDESIEVINLLADITSHAEFEDRNCIKVVCDLYNNALYFSREPIPTRSKESNVQMSKQVCVIPFRRDFLIEYTNLEETPLETYESIDMMRVLENGKKVHMVRTNHVTYAVDTIQDLEKVEELIRIRDN